MAKLSHEHHFRCNRKWGSQDRKWWQEVRWKHWKWLVLPENFSRNPFRHLLCSGANIPPAKSQQLFIYQYRTIHNSIFHNMQYYRCRYNTWDYYCSSFVTNGVIFVIERLYITLDVCTRIHCVGAVICSPRRHTISPSFRFNNGVFRFAYCCRWHRYSSHHLCQKYWTTAWYNYRPFTKDADCGIRNLSGMASRGILMRKCPGVNVSMPSDASGKCVNGLELKNSSICPSTVAISLNVNLASPATTLKCFLKLFTTISHKSPEWGAWWQVHVCV